MCCICYWKRKRYPKPPTTPDNSRCLTLEEVTLTDDTTTDTESSQTTEEEDMDLRQESSVVKSRQRLQDKK